MKAIDDNVDSSFLTITYGRIQIYGFSEERKSPSSKSRSLHHETLYILTSAW